MKEHLNFTDVFYGSGEIDLPAPQGIAEKWLFLKAQCGNTTPAAAYPFGKISLCAYTGGYPTGYGNHCPNSFGSPLKFDAKVMGFSHMHQSGTGGIRTYYNFALTSPIKGNKLTPIAEDLIFEDAIPGYYTAKLSSGVIFEGTVSHNVAYHRYTFDSEGLLQIDFSNSGLSKKFKNFFDIPEFASIRLVSPTKATAHVRFRGIDLYFAAECADAKDALIWNDYEEANTSKLIPPSLECPFGAAFRVNNIATLKLAISFLSCDAAVKMLDDEDSDFDTVKENTANVWGKYLDRISIETDDDSIRAIFYSNLYHSLIKPCNAYKESFEYESGKDFFFDFATLWDMYKTALPLIFTLYPNESHGIAETLLSLTEKYSRSPINVTIAKDNDFKDQARMLVEHVLADYYFRGGEHIAERLIKATERDIETHTDFLKDGFCPRYTQILDLCEALGAVAEIAREKGNSEAAKHLEALANNWINAFDKESGLMSESSPYYEGTNKNYSFRLLRHMGDRIALMGKDRFISELDDLFGYTRDPIIQSKSPTVDPLTFGINSFEGFNNESDIEAPYAYSYVGKHDKTCEILRAGMKHMFTTGRGGLPGNNDSGALSSYYVWNALGLFPVSGQNLILIGSPIVSGARITLATGNELIIKVHGQDNEHIYVENVLFNGTQLQNFRMSVRELMNGGTLEIFMR